MELCSHDEGFQIFKNESLNWFEKENCFFPAGGHILLATRHETISMCTYTRHDFHASETWLSHGERFKTKFLNCFEQDTCVLDAEEQFLLAKRYESSTYCTPSGPAMYWHQAEASRNRQEPAAAATAAAGII